MLLLWMLACGRDQPSPPLQAISEPAPKAAQGVPTPASKALTPAPARVAPTPQDLYAQCEGRVEGTEVDGECVSDDDCASAGCGGEVCTTAAAAAGLTTTCEARLCFQVLDRCGCSEGRCRWSLTEAAPTLQRIKLKLEIPEGL
jgi:eight-cysteine-cluster-containing protein